MYLKNLDEIDNFGTCRGILEKELLRLSSAYLDVYKKTCVFELGSVG